MFKKMKSFALLTIAAVNASDKKVPPKHPLQRLAKLNTFAQEWCDDNLTVTQAENWKGKFDRNTARFERRFENCGFYDTTKPNGGPAERKRRSDEECEADDMTCTIRYDKANPVRGIQQITKGFEKWAMRYVSSCKLQPEMQVNRANYWNQRILSKLMANLA